MQFDWPLRALAEVAQEVTVGYVGTMANQYVETGIPFLRSLNVHPFSIDMEDIKFITPSFHEKLRKSALHPGDVVIVRTGKPGTCAVIPEDIPVANCSDVVVVRCGSMLRPHFLCYWVNSMAASHVDAHTVGAVQQHFNVASAKQLRLPVPSLLEQDAVLAPLRAMDQRIELLRQTNVTLEAIAQALFKSWFVDFDPVRAKAEGRDPPGMDVAIAALFPAEFEETVLGAIPKGWQVEEIGGVAECVGGGTPSTKESDHWEPAIYHWATPKDLSGLGSPVLLDTERSLSQMGLAKVSSGLLPTGTLLMSSRAPIGYLALTQMPLAVNQGFIAMKPGGTVAPEYLYFWCQANMEAIKQKANGSTFMEISKSAFRPILLAVPHKDVIECFVSFAQTIFARIAVGERQRARLADIRDTLLPRLISGKLRLPEAREHVEEALA